MPRLILGYVVEHMDFRDATTPLIRIPIRVHHPSGLMPAEVCWLLRAEMHPHQLVGDEPQECGASRLLARQSSGPRSDAGHPSGRER